MAAASLFWTTNMAAVMSCEKALYHFMPTNIESGLNVGDFMLRDSILTPMFKLGLDFMRQ